MREWISEMLAVSRAWHDKGILYVVLEDDGTYFWLSDGKRRLLEKPKKKKQKHVQVIRHLPEEIRVQLQSITMDAHVRRILKDYQNLQGSERSGCESQDI